jgi:hypothetical protein
MQNQSTLNPEVAKLELIDLIRDRRIVLDRTGRPLPPTGEVWDRADWRFVNQLWAESKGDRQ